MTELLCAVEITGTPATIAVKVNGHVLPCSRAVLDLDAERMPELRITLPVVDGVAVTVDGAVGRLADESRAALISMGWMPPAVEHCCVCASTKVVYHNYLEQPFCQTCADGKQPLSPIAPVPIKETSAPRPEPRKWEYPFGSIVAAAGTCPTTPPCPDHPDPSPYCWAQKRTEGP